MADGFAIRRLFSGMLRAKSHDPGQPMRASGQQLRQLRCSLGLTLRDVEATSQRIADEYQNPGFAIPFSRLFEIESKGMLPTIFRLYSLSVIYRTEYADLLRMFRIDLGRLAGDLRFASVPVTHKIKATFADTSLGEIHTETRLTKPVARVATSGQPARSVPSMSPYGQPKGKLSLVHVGTEDYTMFPLIAPSSLLQVDETVRKVRSSRWRSEHERPIYLFETRMDGFRVGWCSVSNNELTIQPHPLSPTPAKTYRYPVEAEVVGQVVAVSTRLLATAEPHKGALREEIA
jgi:hypothetical protein